jgi:hypothetical protein
MSLGQDGPPTRTRLPESPGGGTGTRGRRATRSPVRSLATVMGVVVLLIAVIAFAGRGGDGSGNGSGGSTSDGDSAAQNHAQATAPTGTKPVAAKGAAGIASGFAHTGQGAQSAAANYAVALGGTGMYAEATRRAVINAVYAPGAAAGQLATLDKAYSSASFLKQIGLNPDGTAPSGMTFVSRTIPVGTKLTHLEGDRATVEVWATALFGLAGEGSTNPVSESWYTETFTLQWAVGDWKVTGYQQKNGPAPVGLDQTASSAKDMSNAVSEFGGFTYAR